MKKNKQTIAKKINSFKEKVVRFCKKVTKVIVTSTIIFLGASYLIYSNESNEERAERLVNDIFTCVAYVEGDKGAEEPYFCGSRWTVAYGVTVKPDGTRVKKTDRVSRETAKEWAIAHIHKNVVPFFKYFECEMTDEQIIGTALFIYNVGGEAVTGYNPKGEKVGDPSQFLLACNSGEDVQRCADCMTGFRRQGGKRANGLLKRHWVQGALFTGYLSVDEVLELKPTFFYETKNMGNYYWLTANRDFVKDRGMFKLRFDKTTLSVFHKMNDAKGNEKSVRDIIPS